MTKSNLKKKMASMAAKVGVKQTQNDFNQACVCFIYQPKLSEKARLCWGNKMKRS